jgi:rhodanese-related sulfurtransferase
MKMLHTMILAILSVMMIIVAGAAYSGDWDHVPERKATVLKLYLHPKEAYEIMAGPEVKKTLFIDIRTREEVMFVGMASVVDANIPYLILPDQPEYISAKSTYKLVPNKFFVSKVEERLAAKSLTKNDRVILMCRSGDRSGPAANTLEKAGFNNVYSVVEGFEGDLSKDGRRSVNGWKNDGLPWSYDLPREKLTNLQ